MTAPRARVGPLADPAAVHIKLEGAGKRFGAFEVFRDVDLEIGEREIVALVGPSGCGKTTLLRCVDGLIPVDEGEIRVDDAPVTDPWPAWPWCSSSSGCSPGRPCTTMSPTGCAWRARRGLRSRAASLT